MSADAYEALLNEIDRQLEAAGVLVKSGVFVDASVTDSLRRPRGRKVYEMVEDRHDRDSRLSDGSRNNGQQSV